MLITKSRRERKRNEKLVDQQKSSILLQLVSAVNYLVWAPGAGGIDTLVALGLGIGCLVGIAAFLFSSDLLLVADTALCSCGMLQLAVSSAERRSLPVETGVTKLVDLDRCYSVSRVPVEGGRELCLYNLHLSAYSSDGSIADEQLRMLLSDMQAEVERGNYVIGGGDFNKDLLPGGSAAYFGVSAEGYTWAQPIRTDLIDATSLTLVAPVDPAAPVASCRNADAPYSPAQLTLTVDGFLVSGNVTVEEATVIDTGFAHSDHNPVSLTFTLNAD